MVVVVVAVAVAVAVAVVVVVMHNSANTTAPQVRRREQIKQETMCCFGPRPDPQASILLKLDHMINTKSPESHFEAPNPAWLRSCNPQSSSISSDPQNPSSRQATDRDQHIPLSLCTLVPGILIPFKGLRRSPNILPRFAKRVYEAWRFV